MNRFLKLAALSAVGAGLWLGPTAQPAAAGGFSINTQSARATAQGGAFFTRASDPSALFYNPAGIARLAPGLGLMAGGTFIVPTNSFRRLEAGGEKEYDMVSNTFFPPNAYATYTHESGFAAGIGAFTQFGLGTEWDNSFPGRFLTEKINLETITVNPTIAYRYGDLISVGVGIDFLIGKKVELRRAINVPLTVENGGTSEGTIELDGNGNGVGYNLGAQLRPIPALTIGLAYRSHIKVDFDGKAAASIADPFGATRITALNGPISTSIDLPANFSAGVAVKANDKLNLEFDYQWYGWSSYDTLAIDFGGRAPRSAAYRGFNDSYTLRGGGEYQIMPALSVGAGLFFDKNPIPDTQLDPTLPDADRLGLSFGAGYNLMSNLRIDASYLYERLAERKVTDSAPAINFNGVYNGSVSLFAVNLGYHF